MRMAHKMAVLSSGSALTRTQRRIFYAEYSSSGETSKAPLSRYSRLVTYNYS